jgi:ADP-ribose pyrophosphatase YjhB (NUDIX family)
MNFSRKVYFNDRPLILTTDREAYIIENPEAEHYSDFYGATLKSFNQAILQVEKPGIRGAIIEDASEESLLDQLGAMYHSIDAAGGLVYNEKGDVLMIFRKGKWDLPKGKLDDGEEITACAVREVMEETGLQHVSLEDKICDTYHAYEQDNEQLLKCTAWYKMRGTSADKLKPQKEENIIEARWLEIDEIAPFATKSYAAIKEVLAQAGVEWKN